ncbi:MAG: hypothetical protein GX922_09010 [Firmicutes bacterium]|nr:hypothetical protein [Bacillota bacterium]
MSDILYSLKIMLVAFTVGILILLLLYYALKTSTNTQKNAANKIKKATGKNNISATKITSSNLPPEIVAAIGAALSASLQRPAQQFKIISIQMQQNSLATNWVWTGRNRLMENRANLLSWRRGKRL